MIKFNSTKHYREDPNPNPNPGLKRLEITSGELKSNNLRNFASSADT